ncbi:MAG: C10 family peptidase [Bacteroidales bacterium]|nr:C10 family peptidase [Bacteroidales bacterium]
MRKALLLCTLLSLFQTSFARPIDLETAKSVAAKFMATNDLQLVSTFNTGLNAAAFYVFNTLDGFVIVSADDCETPIIGYSREGRFDPSNVPVQMGDYLKDFVDRIQYSIENHIVADETTARQWQLVKATGRLCEQKSAKAVAPLLTEKWHQGCLYNSLCPTMSGPCGRAEVGCVAVAMGQIMHYWKYPATGWGAHSYSNAGVTLSADFGNTTYDWDHMPDSLTETSGNVDIEAVATLLYHCGVSVGMRYTTNGSLANSTDVPESLMRYFNYARRVHKENKDDYTGEEWMGLLKGNLDLRQPILYAARGTGNIGHSFVCDGYDDDNLFHFNWGWGGPGDGYFALGNLNPLGTGLNNNQYAILDIIPQYEPCIVAALAFPSCSGSIEGMGSYHIGEQCTLTATPAEGHEFFCWKKDGQNVSYNLSYTFEVNGDINDIEACFSPLPAKQIEASYTYDDNDPGCQHVSLSWNHESTEWNLLEQFESQGEWAVASDGDHIYTLLNHNNEPLLPFSFGKYTSSGDLVELFDIEGEAFYEPSFFAFDGNLFYCYDIIAPFHRLRGIDMTNKTVVDSISVGYSMYIIGTCSCNPDNDGFWISEYTMDQTYRSRLFLIDRSGQRIMTSPTIASFLAGTGFITAGDGSSHLLLLTYSGEVLDYDIGSNTIKSRPLLCLEGNVRGCSVGKHEGKEAMFVAMDSSICIYEIKTQLAQAVGYRIYRSDNEGHTIMLSDEVTGTSFTDSTWKDVPAGAYRYGISSAFANGSESGIVWSESIEKTDHGINENGAAPMEAPVRKVFEDGQIVIINDGKRYTLTGQQLNRK